MYKLKLCTSCNLYKKSVQVATCIKSLYKLQLVQVDLYKLQHVEILNLYKLQLVQAPYLSFEYVATCTKSQLAHNIYVYEMRVQYPWNKD